MLFRSINVSVEYGTDSEKAKAALLEIMNAVPEVLDGSEPGTAAPFTALLSLNDSSITFVCRCWVKTADYWNVYFRLNDDIYTRLPAEYGISFPYPKLDIMIKQ